AVYLLCWIKRYQGELFRNWKLPETGCFIYMGGCRDAGEALFMRYLARIPVDVLILCPNLNERCCLKDPLLYEMNHQTSMVLNKFPEQDGQLRIGTAAYHAERELDTLMYQDSGMFRDQQFAKANSIMLQTMDREIKILWNNDLKFRPNFSTVDGVVSLPVIFAKMSGVKDRDVENYWISIKQLMTPETMVIDGAPFLTAAAPNPMKMYAAEFFKNGKLKRSKIKSHPSYPYSFLREEMQEHILDKLEALIGQKLIKGTFENGMEYTIVSVALNLPKEAVRLLQQFDFTKKNPKLIYIMTSEVLLSAEDSIYVTFLNLLGFDVLFFVPTGYNIENHFNKRLMEEHQIGDYVYDLQVPDWASVPLTARRSWRDIIFKRG
ncbi:MAG: YceG family protein, partial [Lachnospiraceae bacterium]|nr:YceG family protein [Lachnospiraceae bacterium]